MRPKVYITRQIPEEGLNIIKEVADMKIWEDEMPPSREVLLGEIEWVDGLVSLLTDKIDAELMEKAKKLKVVSNYAVGFDNIDLKEATRRGIMVTNTPGVLTETTADLTFALMMASARRLVEADKYVRVGRWKTWGPMLMLGQDLYGATLGLIGLGRIGYAVAKRAKGFDMNVIYYSTHRKEEAEKELGIKYVDLEQLLKESDFVSLHVPLTSDTKHLINKNTLSLMKKTAILINTARGPVVDEDALYEALVNKKIYAAGLDVMNPEPPSSDNPLLKLDNVIVLPHIASASIKTRTKMAIMAAENLVAGLKGEIPRNLVNVEVLKK
ncbi:D-glycerate dehydrogenase [Thermoanaerobacteraceae bacterium SP2]|nr:D-glycerate dehydrogenase [Thermoanaerobacteraceae bacterium SP2]